MEKNTGKKFVTQGKLRENTENFISAQTFTMQETESQVQKQSHISTENQMSHHFGKLNVTESHEYLTFFEQTSISCGYTLHIQKLFHNEWDWIPGTSMKPHQYWKLNVMPPGHNLFENS